MARRVQKQEKPIAAKEATPAAESENEFSDFSGFEDFSGLDSTDDEKEAEEVTVDEGVDSNEKSKLSKLAKNATKNLKPSEDSKRGVVYVGRIPHGLYEPQLRQYLEQFGTITNLRISRNKKTGASKHFGFIEFASKEVAQIVCETMNNYLLFGHLLKVNMMDPSQVHPELFVGANKHYHAIPWDLVNKQRADRKHSREYWEEKQQEFDDMKKKKKQELAELGIIY